MNKRAVSLAGGLIALQIVGFMIYGAMQKNNISSSKSDSELIAAIKNDPEFKKMVQDAAGKEEREDTTAVGSAANGEKGDTGEAGAAGATGAKGATGVAGVKGDTGDSSGNSGTYSRLNTIIAPRDSVTAVTAAQVKSGLFVGVGPSDGTNDDRPKITLPSPVEDASLRGYVMYLGAEPESPSLHRFGASIGYPEDLPAVLGDFTHISPSTIDFSSTPVTIVYEVNGDQKQVTLDEDYTSHSQDLLTDIFAEALAEQSIELALDYNLPGNTGPNYVAALVTMATGDGASLSVVDPGDGDPLDLASVTATPGFAGYRGYDGGDLGIGELNESNPIGGGYTHTWPDEPYNAAQQSMILVATSAGWRSLKTPYRSEFVNYSPGADKFLTSDDKNLERIIDKFDDEIFDIRDRLDALEP